MQYIFYTDGTYGDALKTIGDTYTDFKGTSQVIREHNTETLTEFFDVIDKFKIEIDSDGNHCTHYHIANHTTLIDRLPNIIMIEDAICDEDETLDERLGIIEDVLCELDERINGGE